MTPKERVEQLQRIYEEGGGEALDELALAIFEGLRAHRLKLAQADNVPPYVVASDRALRDIALIQPRSCEELIDAHGIGPAKILKYGDGLVAVVTEVRAQMKAETQKRLRSQGGEG